jgi:hypothetical protein
MPSPLPLGRYRHNKNGTLYEVLGVSRHSETLEKLVVYRALHDSPEFGPNALWVRPLAMFTEMVTLNGREVPRFEYVGETTEKPTAFSIAKAET